MVTLGQRIEELRTEKGLSRPALAAQLGFAKNAVEKYETGRQTPSKEHQEKMAEFFGVSVLYLRGEASDRTRMSNWMEEIPDEPDPEPVKIVPRKKPVKQAPPEGGVLDALLATDQVKELLRQVVRETLRSPEGQAAIRRAMKG